MTTSSVTAAWFMYSANVTDPQCELRGKSLDLTTCDTSNPSCKVYQFNDNFKCISSNFFRHLFFSKYQDSSTENNETLLIIKNY